MTTSTTRRATSIAAPKAKSGQCSKPKPFTITKTFRSQRRPNLRTDIDMEKQTVAIKRHRQQRRFEQDNEDYETTFASTESHQIFIKALLNEVERQYVIRIGGVPTEGHMHPKRFVAWRKLHNDLGRLGAWCHDALEQDERLFGECLSAVGAQKLFAFRHSPYQKKASNQEAKAVLARTPPSPQSA